MNKLGCILVLSALCTFVKAQDIVVTAINKTALSQYEAFNGSVTIKNDGIVGINTTFYVGFYLSTDNTYDASDTHLGTAYISTLEAGTSTSLSKNFYTTLPPGSYYLFVISDSYKQITETDETNNVFAVPNFSITPSDVDFVFNAMTLNKTSVNAQDLFNVSVEIQKSGSIDIEGNLSTTFYLSDDAAFDASDIKIDNEWFSFYAVDNANIAKTYTLTMPYKSPGNYYVIGRTDDFQRNSQFNETNEGNNAMVTPITILGTNVDLTITAPIYIASGYDLDYVSFTVQNNGTTPVGGYQISFYLSTDQFLDGSDPNVYSRTYDAESDRISAGGNVNLMGHLYTYLAPGSYYIIIKLNEGNSLVETNTNNNQTVSQQFEIYTPPIPSITLTSAEFTGSYDNLDQELNLALQFLNSGSTYNTTYQSYDIVIKDPGGNVIHTSLQSENFNNYPGTSITKNWIVNLTQPLSHGNYTVEIRCHIGTTCYTNNYNLTLTIDQFLSTLTGVVKGEDGTPITKGKLFLYQKGDDGIVKFIDQKTFSGTNDYSFQLDTHQHTLYFIPDKNEFPLYVPTILNKAVILKEECYITISSPTNLEFEVLKINPPLPGGNGIIMGSISSDGSISGRENGRTKSMEPIPVILLSENDVVTALTYTDEFGNFEFHDLPAAKYKIVALFELDQVRMDEAYEVDITNQNKTVNIEISSEAIETSQEVFLKLQNITFNDLSNKKFNDSPFTLEANADSDLPITFSSSNEAVAQINNNQIVIVGAGTSLIRASQDGDAFYKPATSVERTLTVDKADQTILFAEIPVKSTTDESFSLDATASSNLEVSFSSDNVAVATVNDAVITIIGPGTTTITASQSGNGNYNGASVSRTLLVELITGTEFGKERLVIFPNPSSGKFYLENGPQDVNAMTLIDVSGKPVNAIQTFDHIDISANAAGIYFLKIATPLGTNVFKIIKK